MKRIVVTGLPGSGKSHFISVAAKYGIPTFSADSEISRLYESNEPLMVALHNEFSGKYTTNKGVDKHLLIKDMCEDPVVRFKVEGIVHPVIKDRLFAFWEANAKVQLTFVEASLFLETGLHEELKDFKNWALVGLDRSDELRMMSLRLRNWNERLIHSIDQWHLPRRMKLSLCDVVVKNESLSLEMFDEKLKKIIEFLISDFEDNH